ncbi:MAG: spermidine/putrescine ABC transporter substrate-binding protein [Agathobacter sp.]|nr:spermidine/putrescine ABC transporter substrate-binding protein [Agathobacter sp.]
MKKKLLSILIASALLAALTACGGSSNKTGETITVLNYGKYFDPKAIKTFEKETGITVKYEEFESPEEMYTKYKAGSIGYDLICSSEYMVQRLMNEGEVLKMDYTGLENYKNLDSSILELCTSFDKNHTYALPYFYGTLGLLYDTTKVDADAVSSWNCLWDPAYKDEVIMMNSMRDTFTPALVSLGYSLNETDEAKLREALDILKKQRADDIAYAYYVDETADAMIGEEAAIALCYSGEAALAMEENDNLFYSIPEEGSNLWVDCWFVPKTCTNQDAVMKFLDFVCRDDISEINFEYVLYSSPNNYVVEHMDEEYREDPSICPPAERVEKCVIFTALSDEDAAVYSKLWQELFAD